MKHDIHILLFVMMIASTSLASATSDSNLSNNIYPVNISIIDTDNIAVVYVDMAMQSGINSFINYNEEFIKKTYPLADDGFTGWKTLNSGVLNEFEDYESQSKADDVIQSIKLYNKVFKAAAIENITRAVGIVPYGYLSSKFPNLLPQNTIGYAWPNTYTVLVEFYQPKTSLIAHELGHTYLLCDEYSYTEWSTQNTLFQYFYGLSCPNANDGDNLSSECYNQGCGTTTLGSIYGDESEWAIDLTNFMGLSTYPKYPWIANDSYSHLLKAMEHNSTYLPPLRNWKTDFAEKALVWTFGLNKNGSIESYAAYTLVNATVYDYSGESNSTYRFIGFDSQNNTIINFSFSPFYSMYTFDGTTIELNVSPIQFIVGIPENLSTVKIFNNSEELKRINVSENPPVVSIFNPVADNIYEEAYNITWTSSDLDGDNVYYAVMVSNNTGHNYATLDIDLNQTFYEINPVDFPPGTNYTIKVLVTDGVNTGTDETLGFTMGNVLNITNSSVIYVNDTYRIFEFFIHNTVNYNLSNVSWTFEPGDGWVVNSTESILLAANETFVLYLAYNYSDNQVYDAVLTVNSSGFYKIKHFTINENNQSYLTGLTALHTSGKQATVEFTINNTGTEPADLNWTVNTGEETIFASEPISLEVNESAIVLVEFNYSTAGTYQVTATALENTTQRGSESIFLTMNNISVDDLVRLYSGSPNSFTFSIYNNIGETIPDVAWSCEMDDGNSINSTENMTITDISFVIFQYNYTTPGTYTINCSATNMTLSDFETANVTVT